jgi:general secretion pathway protein M
MARKLSKREKYAVSAAAGLLCVLAILQFVLFPVIDDRARLRRALEVKANMLEQMRRLGSEYGVITQRSGQLKRRYAGRPKGFTLFSFLDRLAGETGIKDHIAYMKPSSSIQKNGPFKISMVEMKLQAISLKQLTDYLYSVEISKDMVTVKRASFVKKAGGPGAIDAVLQVETVDI